MQRESVGLRVRFESWRNLPLSRVVAAVSDPVGPEAGSVWRIGLQPRADRGEGVLPLHRVQDRIRRLQGRLPV